MRVWVSAGLGVAGLVVLTVAVWLLPDDLAAEQSYRVWLRVLYGFAVAGLVAHLVVRWRWDERTDHDLADQRWRRDKVTRFHTLWAAVVLLVCGLGATAVGGFLRQWGLDLPGDVTSVTAVGCICLVGGLVLSLPGWRRQAWGNPGGRTLGMAGATAMASVVVAGVLAWQVHAPNWGTVATTASPDLALSPESVGSVGWQVTVEGGRTAYRGGSGVIVGVADGVVALSGADGHREWQYRRPGAAAEVKVSSGGGVVVATFSARRPTRNEQLGARIFGRDAVALSDRYYETVVLDANSGEVLRKKAGPLVDAGSATVVTDDIAVRVEEKRTEVYDVASGKRMRVHRRPDACDLTDEHIVANSRSVVIPMTCDTDGDLSDDDFHAVGRYVNLDAGTGKVRHVYRARVHESKDHSTLYGLLWTYPGGSPDNETFPVDNRPGRPAKIVSTYDGRSFTPGGGDTMPRLLSSRLAQVGSSGSSYRIVNFRTGQTLDTVDSKDACMPSNYPADWVPLKKGILCVHRHRDRNSSDLDDYTSRVDYYFDPYKAGAKTRRISGSLPDIYRSERAGESWTRQRMFLTRGAVVLVPRIDLSHDTGLTLTGLQ